MARSLVMVFAESPSPQIKIWDCSDAEELLQGAASGSVRQALSYD